MTQIQLPWSSKAWIEIMPRDAVLKFPSRVFYGWWIVISGLLVDGLKHGTFNRGFTLYVLPI
jgi:hypothetical protein